MRDNNCSELKYTKQQIVENLLFYIDQMYEDGFLTKKKRKKLRKRAKKKCNFSIMIEWRLGQNKPIYTIEKNSHLIDS